MPSPKREKKYCAICGTWLYGRYYYTGRCADHQIVADEDDQLKADALAATRLGMSYGQYIAAKREGRV